MSVLVVKQLLFCSKDIANFHRPKASWYPHDIEVPFKEQGKLATHGPMKIIMKSLGGKGSKLHVDAEETIASLKAKASKKLDFKLSEPVKIFYSGRELEDNKSIAEQNVHPNSVLHLIRTKIHPLPRAQKLPGENKSLRPPGAFKKKSDLSVKDGHVFLMEYCEERPLLLGNAGMGARLCTYYQKSAPGDQTGNLLRNGNNGLGSVVILDPADKSPFLGDIKPGSSQSCLETNMYRAPIFQHKVSSTDYLLVRSSKGKLSIRRIDRIDVVGQQEPHIEVMSPGSKGVQFYIMNRLLVYMYREFRAAEKRGLRPSIRADELFSQFPSLSEAFLRKRLKNCADLQRGSNGHFLWVMKRNFRIPSEEELRRMVTPENVCAYESMQAGLYRLKRLGITRLTHPTGLSSAMNQLPDEAIALAAASHIERELQITPWNLSSNFVSCTNQDRENIERLEITGVGDPSGRGLGFSYVRTTPKAPISNSVVKKKTVVGKGSTVTGTDADLRRLSMEAARELLLKFNVPEEQIAKQTRWHRIALIRKLSSEQAASGVKVDPTTVSKFARGQRMSFLQLQQQTREKCQEIWDRQVQSLCSGDGEENESESEANSDLDSFAGDLENLLDAEEVRRVKRIIMSLSRGRRVNEKAPIGRRRN
ncbi:UNVERIFIED_CONTAM: Transcription initiation factor TFIID subunit [Sesamum latifolium]|uniref:Transcription initiation factor TFIID subunit n=1 Tax=Sesamum latifolium TaxID=2727402 RepID=A0AAW2V1E9_9LAMI